MTHTPNDTGAGPLEPLLLDAAPTVRRLAYLLRALILDVHPGAVEVVRPGDRAASYGIGPKKMSEAHTFIIPHRAHVNVGFYRGTQLPDPHGLLEGTGTFMRHVKIDSEEAVGAAALRRLIEAARDERLAEP